MSKILTWNDRCETHPDHQQGMITNQMLRDRMQEEIDDLRAALDRATVPAVPVGFRLVPVEPTPEMIEAAFAGKMEPQCVQTQIRARNWMRENYAAMIEAAPLPDHAEQAIDERINLVVAAKVAHIALVDLMNAYAAVQEHYGFKPAESSIIVAAQNANKLLVAALEKKGTK